MYTLLFSVLIESVLSQLLHSATMETSTMKPRGESTTQFHGEEAPRRKKVYPREARSAHNQTRPSPWGGCC